jgi:hypothetical protein
VLLIYTVGRPEYVLSIHEPEEAGPADPRYL